eukprot:776549-Rhodomonas_salina.1
MPLFRVRYFLSFFLSFPSLPGRERGKKDERNRGRATERDALPLWCLAVTCRLRCRATTRDLNRSRLRPHRTTPQASQGNSALP